MNILQVSCEGLGRGGVQKVIMDITRNMSDQNQIDIVLFTDEKRYYEDEFIKYGGHIYRIPKRKSKNKIINKIDYYIRGVWIFLRMINILKNKKYDVIHCHNEYESGICNLAAFFLGVKIRISHLHRADYDKTRKNILNICYNKFLQLLICEFSTNIICCSENTKKSFFKKVSNRNESKIRIIHNSIDLKEFDINKYEKRKEKKFTLTHIGQFCDNKNQIFILELIPLLIQKINNIELNLVGFGETYREKLENKINELNIKKYVNILPSDINIPQILSRTDLFIFPSITEGLGIVLLEAQAMEVPCVVSDTISHETNLGLVIYKSLKEDKNEWINEIINLHKGGIPLVLNKQELKRKDISYYIKKINSIYRGEII